MRTGTKIYSTWELHLRTEIGNNPLHRYCLFYGLIVLLYRISLFLKEGINNRMPLAVLCKGNMF